MNALLSAAHAALRPLPAALTRGFPQAIVPLPSITLELREDRVERDGERLEALQLTLRAASPEAADQLSALADQALEPLGLRRAGCRDGAEPGSGAYLKLMAYERRGDAAPGCTLSMAGQAHAARLLSWERQRQTEDPRGLYCGPPRPVDRGLQRGTLTLSLPAAALGALMAGGPAALALPGAPPLALTMTGFRLKNGQLEAGFDETL